ncbi:MAG: hypothetical protein HC888_15960 [Candidatus Competibacteraceae bacterium]|nr:hypothetical protein [Candidatus Competibacteraceae bacterium]
MKSQAQVPHSSTFDRRSRARQSEIALRELDNKLSSLLRVTNTLETQDLSGQFVAIVSHDLRTPLSSVQMSIDMISNGLFGEINESGKQQLERAQRSIERMNALINDLLDLERLKSGSFNINPETLQIDKVIEQAIEATDFHARAHGVNLIYNKREDKCFADGGRVLQVLINLIDNAIKFSKVGQTVEIKSEHVGNYLEIQVTDRGRGIPKHLQSAVFERFVQTNRKDRLKRNGSGLGLAICKEIVLNHGGEIGVASKPGYGSTFWFRLPIEPPGFDTAFRIETKSGESSRKNTGDETVKQSSGCSQPASEAAQPYCPKSVMAECVSFSTVPSKELPLLKFQQCLIEAAMAVNPVTVSRRSDSFGQMELRKELQEFLWRRRGIACSPEQIIIFHSTEGGLDLLCRLIVGKDDFVAVEDPCFPGIGMNLASNGIGICPVPWMMKVFPSRHSTI